jgi:hypothetical protein
MLLQRMSASFAFVLGGGRIGWHKLRARATANCTFHQSILSILVIIAANKALLQRLMASECECLTNR